MKTVTSRDFNQDVSSAKRASKKGPVFITDRGKPSHVLLSIEDYQALSASQQSLADAFSNLPAGANDDVEFPRVMSDTPRAADLDD